MLILSVNRRQRQVKITNLNDMRVHQKSQAVAAPDLKVLNRETSFRNIVHKNEHLFISTGDEKNRISGGQDG
jgi:hypothetical protein